MSHHRHDFDPTSGWCLGGCGLRDDGHTLHGARPVMVEQPRDITEPLHPREAS